MDLIVVLLLILIVFGTFPLYPYNRSWGYGPTSIFGVLLVILLVWILLGHRF